MRTTLVIARKELVSYLATPRAWIVFAAMSLLTGVMFVGLLEAFRDAQQLAGQAPGGWSRLPPELQAFRNLTDGVVVNLWSAVLLVTLFVAPFLSMRLLAEERRNQTIALLLTTPIELREVVLGKYLGGVAIIWCTLGVTLLFPTSLLLLGSSESGAVLEWHTVLLGFAALLAWGALHMAIGLFVSSLTESQMVSAFVSFTIAAVWLGVSALGTRAGEPWRSVLRYLSFDQQLQALLVGVLDPRPFALFASVIVFFLVLTHRSLEARRWG